VPDRYGLWFRPGCADRLPNSREEEECRALAFMRIVQPPLVTTEIYDAVTAELNLTAEHPEGLISHAAGVLDGVWQIVEIWDGEEYAQRFDTDRLVPAIEAVTGSPPPGTRQRSAMCCTSSSRHRSGSAQPSEDWELIASAL
jgi:hypothetical protein